MILYLAFYYFSFLFLSFTAYFPINGFLFIVTKQVFQLIMQYKSVLLYTTNLQHSDLQINKENNIKETNPVGCFYGQSSAF